MTRMCSTTVLALAAVLSVACTTPLEIGEECNDSSDCVEGLSCIFTSGEMTTSVCMADCDSAATVLCAGGEICIPATLMGVPREAGVCFLGGEGEVGATCTSTFDCTRGTLCVEIVGSGNSCRRPCDVGGGEPACQSTETCEPLVGVGSARGYCAPM